MSEVYELARRYSKALFDSIDQQSQREQALDELRVLNKAIQANHEISDFLMSQVVSREEKLSIVAGLKDIKGVSEQTLEFVKFLIRRNRIDLFDAIVSAYQDANDEANGVVRGVVRSVKLMSKEECDALSARISKVTGKRAILEYKEDETLIGGLVAQVGSYKFDDSLETQLHLLGEELKRRAH